MDMGIDVTALNFVTPFFGMGPGVDFGKYTEDFRGRMEKLYGIRTEVIDISEKYIEMVGSPPHGYGKHFNPCLDCKILMVSEAKRYIEETAAEGEERLIVTGEVLGQRPMSQRRDTLRVIERKSDTEGILLRPLSARLLEPTLLETGGYIDRESLLGFSGRNRKPQMALAEKLGIKEYQTPAGGCCLTDPIISERIKRLYEMVGSPTPEDIYMVRVGRPFLLKSGVILTVGRDDGENRVIERMGGGGALFVKLLDFAGPLGLMRGIIDVGDGGDGGHGGDRDNISLAISILARYSKARDESVVKGAFGSSIDVLDGEIEARPIDQKDIDALRF
jgi:hypothetical protein